MIFSAEDYRGAAAEHITIAGQLYRHGYYVLLFYVSGLAVECMLRAYKVRIDPQFDERHELRRLSTSFLNHLEEPERSKLNAAVDYVWRLWRNDHRFCSRAKLWRFLKSGNYDRGIRGDALKENARRLLVAASRIIEVGNNRWKS